nr:nitroreductase family protein [uncultured Ruminococcus sp.]
MKKIRKYAKIIRNQRSILAAKQTPEGKLNACAAELIRDTHSMEKGLSIVSPRLGFGHKKQIDMMSRIEKLYESGSEYHREACQMALCSLQSYIDYHKKLGYDDEVCQQIIAFLERYPAEKTARFGGTVTVDKSDLRFDTEQIERFFRTRHSIRDFDDKPVDDEVLKKALALAQTAPSACNRQGVRTYVLSREKSNRLAKSLEGIGGFADNVDRFIIITGKTSAYRENEINQYIVSPGIYAAYLSLTLHLYGLGACVVQRNVIWTKEGKALQDRLGIPSDEQIICLLAVGNLKEQFTAPVSYRLSASVINRFVD